MSENKKKELSRCKLSWVGDQPVVECPKGALTEATRLIQTKGILIKEVRIVKPE